EILPGEVRRTALGQNAKQLLADAQRGTVGAHALTQRAVHRVVFQQMGERVGIGDVIDGDEIEIGARCQARAKDVSTDASKAVDSYANAHHSSRLRGSGGSILPESLVAIFHVRIRPSRRDGA